MPDPVILIPAYEPGHELVDLVRALPYALVLVVDDGSGPAYAPIFAAARESGALVITLDRNQGKGVALRTGFRWVAEHEPGRSVVCADSDGQHRSHDVVAVAARLESGADLVLGARRFGDDVPFRSRLGNAVTGVLFRWVTGRRLIDTQTGLRGYPAHVLGWLGTITGDRYEYELRVLLRAAAEGRRIDEVGIETVYLAGNASSHFRPIRDSARIYAPLLRHGSRTVLRFTGASLSGFVIDVTLFSLLFLLTGQLVAAAVGARLVSATANYLINRHWVFRGSIVDRGRGPAVRYALLAVTVLLLNVVLLQGFSVWLGSVAAAKIITEVVLFIAGFVVQRLVVFPRLDRSRPLAEHSSAPHTRLTTTAQGGRAH